MSQGRLYYEAANSSGLEIRPLLLYYGALAYATALVLGRGLYGLASLPRSHGLTDASEVGCQLQSLQIKVERDGLFQRFNDTVAPLTRLTYIDAATDTAYLPTPACQSAALHGTTLSTEDILSRIPGCEELFEKTFSTTANAHHFSLSVDRVCRDGFLLRIDVRERFQNRDELREVVEVYRKRFPKLRDWRLVSAVHAWGCSVLEFANLEEKALDEFDDAWLPGYPDDPHVFGTARRPAKLKRLPINALVPACARDGTHLVAPLANGEYPSEFAYYFALLCLASFLVRYRPDSWVHALSGSATPTRPADDQALAVLDDALGIASQAIPGFVADAIGMSPP